MDNVFVLMVIMTRIISNYVNHVINYVNNAMDLPIKIVKHV